MKKIVLGVTGSFGSGKTTCAGMFESLGARCINADKIYHKLIRPQTALYKKIVSVFGQKILAGNKQIDKKALAGLVFKDSRSLKTLSQLTHPAVIKEIILGIAKLKRTKRGRIIVIDAPLLIESGLTKMVDKLIVVKTARNNQVTRIKQGLGIPAGDALKRIRRQLPLARKIKLADYVIDNNGTLEQTRKQVKRIWEEINKNKVESRKKKSLYSLLL